MNKTQSIFEMGMAIGYIIAAIILLSFVGAPILIYGLGFSFAVFGLLIFFDGFFNLFSGVD